MPKWQSYGVPIRHRLGGGTYYLLANQGEPEADTPTAEAPTPSPPCTPIPTLAPTPMAALGEWIAFSSIRSDLDEDNTRGEQQLVARQAVHYSEIRVYANVTPMLCGIYLALVLGQTQEDGDPVL